MKLLYHTHNVYSSLHDLISEVKEAQKHNSINWYTNIESSHIDIENCIDLLSSISWKFSPITIMKYPADKVRLPPFIYYVENDLDLAFIPHIIDEDQFFFFGLANLRCLKNSRRLSLNPQELLSQIDSMKNASYLIVIDFREHMLRVNRRMLLEKIQRLELIVGSVHIFSISSNLFSKENMR